MIYLSVMVGINFVHIAKQLNKRSTKIYFSTGAYWKFHNQQESLRFLSLRQRRKSNLPQDRYIKNNEDPALQCADGIIGIGNEFTRQTYDDFPNVQMVNGTFLYDEMFDWCSKDYEVGRNHFLFYSGGGNIHKGLDILLEAFSKTRQHLWICTKINKNFANIYKQELKNLRNIHLIGWVQPRSLDFYKVIQTCNFSILPSCSEGQSHSVIECMGQGLIPLITQETGVSVNDFGISIKACTITGLRQLIQDTASLSPRKCQELSRNAHQIALSKFSEHQFSKYFQEALDGL